MMVNIDVVGLNTWHADDGTINADNFLNQAHQPVGLGR